VLLQTEVDAMRILFSSHVFAPSIGGLQTVSQLLAEEFVRQGHEVRLITQTPGTGDDHLRFPVFREPSAAELLAQVRWCDVYFHNNISLPRAWPLLLVRRPWVVAHHVWIPRAALAGRLKRTALRFAIGISVSRAVAQHLSTASRVIPNPYDDATFRELPQVRKTRDVVFLGRLVSDKGAEVLIAAVAKLHARGLAPSVTIIGAGPEEDALRSGVASLGLNPVVTFAGTQRGEALVELLNAHRIIVIPSLWEEPFGIVALEGMACGCVPVGSVGGGLGEAIGDCGETFPNGDVDALSQILEALLCDPDREARLRAKAREHLQRHTRASVAQEYLHVFAGALGVSDDARAHTRSV
jgi:glycogen synthase